MVQGVEIYGGFEGMESSLSEREIESSLTVLHGQDTVIVINGANGAILNGFTVTGGRETGMRNTGVSPLVVDCIFESNGSTEGSFGGAIQNLDNANAYISSSAFTDNHMSAIYNEDSSPTINNCSFYGNSSDSGGAIVNRGQNSRTYIVNTLFDGNSASLNGGAISNASSDPQIENCIFSNNSAGESGGAVSNYREADPNIINCLFVDNSAAQSGGAVYNLEKCSPVITNCTIVDNHAGSSGGGVYHEGGSGREQTIVNSIFRGNYGSQIEDGSSSKTSVTYSNIEGGYSGTGNIDADPSFIDTTIGDYRLQSDSPSIDTGDNSQVTASQDLLGNPRITDGDVDGAATVDMGAYEFQP
jgi:predicted outer membrane repeat protein